MKELDLTLPDRWEIKDVRDASAFFLWLSGVLDAADEVYLEADGMPQSVKSLLSRSAIMPTSRVPPGSAFPRSPAFTCTAAPALLQALAGLAENLAEPEVCSHIVAYRAGVAILVWYDAFSSPLWLTRAVPRSKVEELCELAGGTFQ